MKRLPSALVVLLLGTACASTAPSARSTATGRPVATAHDTARSALDALTVKGRAPMTGYARARFGRPWVDVDHNGCDTRNDVLRRDLADVELRPGTHDCVVVAGVLHDPYSGATLEFVKLNASAVQIDHVVALGDAWQTGAAAWDDARRVQFANDPLELLAVDGRLNEAKGDGDAATWLPPRASGRCAYVARQIAVKAKWSLWVTTAERDAMQRVLAVCPDQRLPQP